VDLFTRTACSGRPFDPPQRGTPFAPLARHFGQAGAFRFGEVFVAGPWFATEFKCTFRRRRTGHKIVVRGALFCETSGDLLSEMRMYWDRVVDRLPG
jgi:hypothetical protein